MGETACLRRSFSSPSQTSLDFSQGDPVRALGDSVSFGRYLSEPLAWEKWSAFTNNRYVEEAEKSSKPGSVAKMKAYFEAHYERFGARKQTEVSSRVHTEVVSISVASSPKTVPADVHLLSSETAQVSDKHRDAAESSVQVVVVADGVNRLPEDVEIQVIQCQEAEVDASVTGSSSENIDKETDGNDVVSTASERRVIVKREALQEKPEKEKLDSMSEQSLADYSVKRSKKSNLSKLSSSLARLATPVHCKKDIGTPNRKVSKLSSSFARLATPVRPRKEGLVTPSNRMLVKDPIEKKKLISRTLHMSINVSSDINVMKKASPSSRKSGVGKLFTPLGKIIRDSFASSTPSRASVKSVSRLPSATPQTETRRSRVALEKSFDSKRRLDQKLKSPSIVNVKSSTKSPATFASFSFRTEERAGKRREFFQKRLEKEAENLQALQHLDKSKVKPTPDLRKTSQLRNLKANSAAYIRPEVLIDTIKKLPTSCQAPKVEVEAKPVSQRTTGSKSYLKCNKTLPSSLKMKKKTQENASPNIM